MTVGYVRFRVNVVLIIFIVECNMSAFLHLILTMIICVSASFSM